MTHDSFINDVHPLVRSFIPGEEIEVEYSADKPESVFFISVGKDGETLVSFEIKDKTKEDRLLMKNELKCTLYRELSRRLNISLPWGTLSGIRPSRLAMNHLSEGFSPEETREWMGSYYLVSSGKAALATDIAVREQRIIERVNSPGSYSLYIGIPFCPTTCLYCSFPSNAIALWKDRVGEYLKCLEKELLSVREAFDGRPPVTIYVGGGTPVTLNEDELKTLFHLLNSAFDLKDLKELTVEAGRPDAITPGKLKVLKEYGTDRISVNPQTMNDLTLKKIGRLHSVSDTVRAFNEARDAGFDNINMDIILGLPDEDTEDVKHTLSEISEMGPEDLTIHCLALKKGSALKERMDEQGYSCYKDMDLMMDAAYAGAEKMGLSPYYLYRQKNMSGNFENTGWSKAGREGLYNILMMEEVQSIAAIGAGTVSKYVGAGSDSIKRMGAPKDLKSYFEKIDDIVIKKKEMLAGK